MHFGISHPGLMRRNRISPTMVLYLSLSVGILFVFGVNRHAVASGASRVAAVRKLLRDDEPSKRAAAVRRLAGDPSPAALALVWRALGDNHPYVRGAAYGVLGLVPDGKGRKWIRRAWRKEKRDPTRLAALTGMLLWGVEPAMPTVMEALGHRSPAMRRGAIEAYVDVALPAGMNASGDEDTDEGAEIPQDLRRVLLKALHDKDGGVRAWSLRALLLDPADRYGRDDALTGSMLARLLQDDDDPRVRLSALEGSVALGSEKAVFAVLRGLTDAVWSVRLRAAELAGATRDRRVLEALPPHLEDARRRVVRAVHHALVELTGIPFEPHKSQWVAWLHGDGKRFDPAQASAARNMSRKKNLRKGTVTGERTTFLDLTLISRHVTFVLDRSGSMNEPWMAGARATSSASKEQSDSTKKGKQASATRWREVVARLDTLLRTLGRERPAAVVNVVVFGNRAEAIFPRAVPLTPGRIQGIRRWLEKTEPAGRTALYDGIELALTDPVIDNLVVLSDGAPSAGAYFTKTALLRNVRAANHWRRARIDVIAIGAKRVAKRWRDLLVRLAKASGGVCLNR